MLITSTPFTCLTCYHIVTIYCIKCFTEYISEAVLVPVPVVAGLGGGVGCGQ